MSQQSSRATAPERTFVVRLSASPSRLSLDQCKGWLTLKQQSSRVKTAMDNDAIAANLPQGCVASVQYTGKQCKQSKWHHLWCTSCVD
eukprot:879830-Alexandrium_andersonii.AAC.1